jgi:hypothetical protein
MVVTVSLFNDIIATPIYKKDGAEPPVITSKTFNATPQERSRQTIFTRSESVTYSAGAYWKTAFHYRRHHFNSYPRRYGEPLYRSRIRIVPVSAVKIRPDNDIAHIDGAGKPPYKNSSRHFTEILRKVNQYAGIESRLGKQFQLSIEGDYVSRVGSPVKKLAWALPESYGNTPVRACRNFIEQGLVPTMYPVKHTYRYRAFLRPRLTPN